MSIILNMADVTLRSEDSKGGTLTISEPFLTEPDFHNVVVTIQAPGLSCTREVLTYRGDGLREFFGRMEADWRGWEGDREWNAIEHGMSITARHTGRRVELIFTLRRDYEPDAWRIIFPMTVAPGEALTQLSRDMATAFRNV